MSAGGTVTAAWQEATDQLTAPGQLFAWSVQEVDGVPLRIYDAAPRSMRDVFAGSASRGADDYLVFGPERLSYAEVHRQVRSLASHLVSTHGVGKGDRVAVAMRNYPEWVVTYWATVSLGAVVVALNAWWTAEELLFGMADSMPKVLVVDGERWERLAPVRDRIGADVIVTRVEDSAGAQLSGAYPWAETVDGDNQPSAEVDIGPDDDLCVFYTSGTTGLPKGAVTTHRGAVHNIMNMGFYTAALAHVRALLEDRPPADTDDRAQPAGLIGVPLFHVTGCNCYLHPSTAIGGKIVLMHRWDATEALRLIHAERPRTLAVVPSMSREIVTHPDFDRYDTSSVGSLGGGGSPMHPDLVHKIADALPGGAPGTGYGLTETSGVVTMNIGRAFRDKPTTVGPPLPTVEVKVVDADGTRLGVGQAGELLVRSPIVFRGYLNNPEATAAARGDGWLRTGDIAVLDEDGFIAIVDRAKDLVIRGGENIGCAEVEAAVYEHPAVAETVVFAVPDERLGEVPGAAVVLHSGASLDAEELRAHLAPRLAAFKIPERIWFLDEPLPRNASGKFLKRQLRQQLLEDTYSG